MPGIKLLNVVGARPQIIKASAISRAIRNHYQNKITEVIIHTGQHYDKEMSDIFFDELEIHKPHFNLGVGSASHGKQTSMMLAGLEDILNKERPDCVILYGDTNSTLAGAIAASKLHFPIVHIEAGLRSFNKKMPEEINRIVSDHCSTLLFAPTNAAFKNLMAEGFRPENSPPYTIDNPKIYLTGDIMYDNSLFFASLADNKKRKLLEQLSVLRDNFVLVTIHRDSNTDDLERLQIILSSLRTLSGQYGIVMVMPFHPRTINTLKSKMPEFYKEILSSEYLRFLPPVSFLEMTMLEKNCKLIITDSGGVQKESHFFRKPCLVLRKETEWIELVQNGTAKLVDADPELIAQEFGNLFNNGTTRDFPSFYGDGKAAEFILKEIMMMFEKV